MALINRVSQLFKADANAVLDCIEDPELLLRQAIREMHENISARAQQLKRLQHEAEQLQANEAEIKLSVRQLDEELEVCLSSDKHDLARVVIRKKLLADKIYKNNSKKREALKNRIDDSEKCLSDHQSRLLDMQQKADILIQQNEDVDEVCITGTSILDLHVKDEDIEVALLQALKMRASS
ncbi:hypothetical protein MNBD_GAMMA11-2424 [hydrothermal vent metagenome]|uniref:Phage shock protein A n=1 Tax=hydrothermal vent metagenome TaxID=652676 RepID=A0A3B0Y793_9ZZZZ